MNAFILAVSWVLAKILNWVIVLLAFAEVALMALSRMKMTELRKRIDQLNASKHGKPVQVHREDGRVTSEYTVTIDRDWREFDTFCDDYQKSSVLFSWVSLIIQVFPLLGILGTVTGLFIAMNGNADWTQAQSLFEGVRFALSSTVLGILFAVIFKVADILFSAKYLGYIDDGIMRFRENYNVEKELPSGGEAE